MAEDTGAPVLSLSAALRRFETAEPEQKSAASGGAGMTEAERKAAGAILEELDVTRPDHVMRFGDEAQKKTTDLCGSVMSAARAVNASQVSEKLASFTAMFRADGAEDEKPAAGFRSTAASLENDQAQLLKSVALFDRLYRQNSDCFRLLTIYILIAQQKLDGMKNGELKKLLAAAKKKNSAADNRRANELSVWCDRFGRKLKELAITRELTRQMAGQLQTLRSYCTALAERISAELEAAGVRSLLQPEIKMTGNAKADETIAKGIEILHRIREANAAIPDIDLTEQMDSLEDACTRVFQTVSEKPDSAPLARRLLSYYLPTSLKTLNNYREMKAARVSKAQLDEVHDSLVNALDLVIKACQKQLDQMHQVDVLDVETDIDVLQQMVMRDGLSDNAGPVPEVQEKPEVHEAPQLDFTSMDGDTIPT